MSISVDNKAKMGVALGIFIIGSVVAIRALQSGRAGPSRNQTPALELDTADREPLDYLISGVDAPSVDIVHLVAQSAKRSLDGFAGGDQLSLRRSALFLQAAQDRLSLYLDPSWDWYVSQVRSITGREPTSDQAEWELYAAGFVRLPVAPELASVEVRYRAGEQRQAGIVDTRETYRRDDGTYCEDTSIVHGQGIEKQGLDVYELVLPAVFPDELNPPATFEGWLVLSFYWDQSRNKWVPWRSAVRMPDTGERIIAPSPWL